MTARCLHLDFVRSDQPLSRGCEECLKLGDSWLHLRLCGDVRCGSVKRIASAVGAGSITVQLLHRALRDLKEAAPSHVVAAA